jgi:hypothetical protein
LKGNIYFVNFFTNESQYRTKGRLIFWVSPIVKVCWELLNRKKWFIIHILTVFVSKKKKKELNHFFDLFLRFGELADQNRQEKELMARDNEHKGGWRKITHCADDLAVLNCSSVDFNLIVYEHFPALNFFVDFPAKSLIYFWDLESWADQNRQEKELMGGDNEHKSGWRERTHCADDLVVLSCSCIDFNLIVYEHFPALTFFVDFVGMLHPIIVDFKR